LPATLFLVGTHVGAHSARVQIRRNLSRLAFYGFAGGYCLLPAAGPAQTAAVQSLPGSNNPIVANIEGHPIYLSEIDAASPMLPDNLRGLPFDTLYPVLLDRLIDHQALVIMAQRAGLDVRRDSQPANEQQLEGAYLRQQLAPTVTEPAIQAHYRQLYADRTAISEVRARHLLVDTEAEARDVLEQLRLGADFATLARQLSHDPDAVDGGDLGFFRREQVWPGLAEAAFALAPGQIAPDPIKNEFGWHVIKQEDRRQVPPPSLAESHEQIRQDLLAAGIRATVRQARSQLLIHRFNVDGSDLDPSTAAPVAGAPRQ
jgi:peptidyl-prolyl cis-trans isomerase C